MSVCENEGKLGSFTGKVFPSMNILSWIPPKRNKNTTASMAGGALSTGTNYTGGEGAEMKNELSVDDQGEDLRQANPRVLSLLLDVIHCVSGGFCPKTLLLLNLAGKGGRRGGSGRGLL